MYVPLLGVKIVPPSVESLAFLGFLEDGVQLPHVVSVGIAYLTSKESTFHHLIRAATILVFTQTFYALLLRMVSLIQLISIQEVALLVQIQPLLLFQKQSAFYICSVV